MTELAVVICNATSTFGPAFICILASDETCRRMLPAFGRGRETEDRRMRARDWWALIGRKRPGRGCRPIIVPGYNSHPPPLAPPVDGPSFVDCVHIISLCIQHIALKYDAGAPSHLFQPPGSDLNTANSYFTLNVGLLCTMFVSTSSSSGANPTQCYRYSALQGTPLTSSQIIVCSASGHWSSHVVAHLSKHKAVTSKASS